MLQVSRAGRRTGGSRRSWRCQRSLPVIDWNLHGSPAGPGSQDGPSSIKRSPKQTIHLSKSTEASYQVPKSILETVIYSDDLDAAGEFYEKVIGLTLFSHEPNRHRFYQVGGGMLLIFRPESTETDSVEIGGRWIPKHGAHGPGHLAFAVGEHELESVRGRLAQFQIPIEVEIDWPSGGHSVYCRDPANNSVEFATRSLWFRSG